MTEQELLYTMALTQLFHLNSKPQRQLLTHMGSATAVYENRHEIGHMIEDLSPRAAEQLTHMDEMLPRCEEELTYTASHHIRVLAIQDTEGYPSRLRECDDAPLILYYLGNGNLNARHIISVVGTRRCTQYGRDLCRQLARDLAHMVPDTLIVSGLAYGIDVAAHRSSLDAGLNTVGVLGHGLDQVYPRSHRQTAIEMLAHGGLLTEFMSHSPVDKLNFVQRNRIVAGMADATIVVESPERGGSLITAEMANGYHREVFTFPGRIGDETSKGCNLLIRRNAATLMTSAEDLITDLGWEMQKAAANAQKMLFPDLSPDETTVVQLMREAQDDLSLFTLKEQLAWPVTQLMPLLVGLEMKGIVKTMPGNRYHLTR